MPIPDFSPGEILTAAVMDSVGLWRVTGCTVTSVGGTAATASNGVITVGTGNTSVTVNAAFSSAWDTYLIVYNGGTMSVDTALKLQVGATTTGYYGNYIYGAYTATTVLGANDNNAAAFTYAGGGADCFAYAVVGQPFASKPTEISSRVRYATNNGTYSGVLANTTSYTAFTFIPFSGTMSGGTIRVYGYNK